MDSEHLLKTFREEWKLELENRQNENVVNQGELQDHSSSASIQRDIETEAADLFKKGAQLEQDGQLYESIWYYRKAIGLVPDIETKVHVQYKQDWDDEGSSSDEEDGSSDDCNNLISKFEALFLGNQPFCIPEFPQDAPHLSCLPNEMIDRILHWIIGAEMDLESLDKVSMVCRGFFVMCRNQDIWRRACMRVWGIAAVERITSPFSSWREMFIWRPRPRYNGCYISKTTYFRSGENNFQDRQRSLPWHFVCYYRFLRFFPDGKVIMLTTSDEPQTVVGLLRNSLTAHPQVLVGKYRIHGCSLNLVFEKKSVLKKVVSSGGRFRKRREQRGTTDVESTTFEMEFEVKEVRKRPNWQLSWSCYSIVSYDGEDSHRTSVVNVSDQMSFPPLMFSRVKSYTAESEEPFD